MNIAVGSDNPVKIEAVRDAFATVWPDKQWKVVGVKVGSGVSDQPMSDEESIRGARTRATRARERLDADFGVGLESGLQQVGEHHFDCGWIVIIDRAGIEGIGSSVKMLTPPKMMAYVRQRMELGDVDDRFFNQSNSKQQSGHFGLMTKGALTRTRGYRDAVITALVRFIRPEVF